MGSYAWLNDQSSLRKMGRFTDAYQVFKHLLKRINMPSTISELIQGTLGPSHELQMLRRLGLRLFESFLKKIDHF